jgi:AcrR family transcriptional regulator
MQVPDAFARLWSEQPPTARRRGLHVDRVIEAAIEVADADGLEAVSMSRVAQQVGYTTMSLYRHVQDKDELLMRMFDAALPPAPDPAATPGDWRPRLRAWARAMLTGLAEHPWLVHVPIRGPLMTPNQLAWLDAGLAALADTALTEAEKAEVVLLVNGAVFWEARLADDLRRAAAGRAERPTGGASISDALAALIGPDRFPALRRALAEQIFDDEPEAAEEHDVDFALETLLDGVEALVRRRAAPG